jgi:hypothetical protein
MNTARISFITLAILVPSFAILYQPSVFLNFFQPPDQSNEIKIESTSISRSSFAILGYVNDESRLYWGEIDQSSVIEIQSSHSLASVFISDGGTIYFAEWVGGEQPVFRLYSANKDLTGVRCDLLVQSHDFIGQAFTGDDVKDRRVFFTTGQFEPVNFGLDVVPVHIAALDDGTVTVLRGNTFLDIHGITDAVGSRFLGIDWNSSHGVEGESVSEQLVEFTVAGDLLRKRTIALPIGDAGTFSTAAETSGSRSIYLTSYDFDGGLRHHLIMYDGSEASVLDLPRDRFFGPVIAVDSEVFDAEIVLTSTSERDTPIDKGFDLTPVRGMTLGEPRHISLVSTKVVDINDCNDLTNGSLSIFFPKE